MAPPKSTAPEQIPAKVIVGLDFGTTFSGFAYAHKDSPADVKHYSLWPDQGEAGAPAYCKTQTSLFYERSSLLEPWNCVDWGWSAHLRNQEAVDHLENGEPHMEFAFVTRFKLLLAAGNGDTTGVPAEDLPQGLDVDTAITDYLSLLSKYALQHLKVAYGEGLSMRDLQWCLTVPAIWDDSAKQRMGMAAEKAGMVSGRHCPRDAVASPHSLMLVLEPEAASFYCLKHWNEMQLKHKVTLGQGDQYMIVDIGGGTTDIVVHESVRSDTATGAAMSMVVQEVTASHGGLAGGTYADRNFTDLVHRRVGCFQDFVRGQRSMHLELQVKWEQLKTTYSGNLLSGSASLRFPVELAEAWKQHDLAAGRAPLKRYDCLVISNEDIRATFDPVVDEIARLVEEKLDLSDCKAMLVVGGFASSKYVENQLRHRFADRLNGNIVYPSNPGSAICYGAVLMGMASAGVKSRIARKSYGISTCREFREGVDPDHLRRRDAEGSRSDLCDQVVDWLVEKGQTLSAFEAAGSKEYRPHSEDQTELAIEVYSTSQEDRRPCYTDAAGIVQEGRYLMDISQDLEKGRSRHVSVSMYFGGSSIVITGRRIDFGPTDQVDRFEVTL